MFPRVCFISFVAELIVLQFTQFFFLYRFRWNTVIPHSLNGTVQYSGVERRQYSTMRDTAGLIYHNSTFLINGQSRLQCIERQFIKKCILVMHSLSITGAYTAQCISAVLHFLYVQTKQVFSLKLREPFKVQLRVQIGEYCHELNCIKLQVPSIDRFCSSLHLHNK